MTEPEYDSGTATLIADLEAAAPSYWRDEILKRAKKRRYHCFSETGYDLPKVMLVKHLEGAGLRALADAAKNGRYDQPSEEATKWAQTDEAKRVFAQLAGICDATDADARAVMDEMAGEAAAQASERQRAELEQQTATMLREIMAFAKPRLPKNVGMILFMMDFGAAGNIAYSSNVERQGAISAIREWLGYVED